MRAIVVAVSMITAFQPRIHHHHVRCAGHQSCILAEAQYECGHWHSARHCRIMRRFQWRVDRAAHTFRMHELARPAPASAPTADVAVAPSSFAQCVAFRESGGNWAENTGNGYYGAFQFDLATWAMVLGRMGVSGWPANPAEATPAEQIEAFDYWSSRDPGAWPNTIPACGG